MIWTKNGPGYRIVHEESPPRILVRDLSGKIKGYIDVASGQEIAATPAQLIAKGVPEVLVKDLEIEKL